MEKFDQFLDKTKAKKATITKKNSKNKNTDVGKGKTLAQNMFMNAPLIHWLKPNLNLNKRLNLLQICGINLSKDSWSSLSEWISNALSLETLAINKCSLPFEFLESLEDSLRNWENCQTLDLRGNNIPDSMGGLIVRIMQAQTEKRDSIIWVYSIRNEYPEHIDRIGLKSIILRRNKLGKHFMQSLSRWVQHDDYMRHIDISYNRISSDLIKTFWNQMKENSSLVSIEMHGNTGYSSIVQK